MKPRQKILNTSVSIVTYKDGLEELHECLQHYVKFIPPIKIYVIDNSPSNSLESISVNFGTRYVHRPDNPGYGAGHNIAIRNTLENGCDFHLVVNRDVWILENDFKSAIEYLTDNTNIGALNPKVIWPDGRFQKLCKLIPSPLDLIQKLLLGFTPLNYEFNYSWFDGSYTVNVPYLSGCCMFLRVDALRKVGLFDERFFMYPEDIDLSRRIASNYDTVMLHESIAIHDYGGHSKKSLRFLYLHITNMARYFNKWGWARDSIRKEINNSAISENRRRLQNLDRNI